MDSKQWKCPRKGRHIAYSVVGPSLQCVCFSVHRLFPRCLSLCVHYPLQTVPGLHWQCVNYSHRSVAPFLSHGLLPYRLPTRPRFPADSAQHTHQRMPAHQTRLPARLSIDSLCIFRWFTTRATSCFDRLLPFGTHQTERTQGHNEANSRDNKEWVHSEPVNE